VNGTFLRQESRKEVRQEFSEEGGQEGGRYEADRESGKGADRQLGSKYR
jgi:hypothetical protein